MPGGREWTNGQGGWAHRLGGVAGRIRESDIALVRERSRIDEVVGDHVSLQRAGGGALKGLCPFHDEKTPSFNVRPSHGTFHCFGCGEGGDVIAFVMKIEHLSFVEAVERLADRAGIQLTYEGGGADGPARPGHARQADRGAQARRPSTTRSSSRRPTRSKAREFLAERGFDEAAARQFGCGFAPGGWDKLTKHLLGRGFELQELIKSQLAKEGRQGPIDRFHRRLLWPIKDIGGDVVGFGARRIFDDDPIQAKYLNTSESLIYKKSHVLFGLDLAKREIAKRQQVVIVEGYTDVMAMHLAGVPTAVASCGTAFGTDHMNVLRRLLIDDDVNGEVIFTFDGDEAGQKAALKAFEGEQQFSAQTYIAVAPDGMDPCELRQAKGDVAVRDLVARRTPLIEFAIKAAAQGVRPRLGGRPRRGVEEDGAVRRADQGPGQARRLRDAAGLVGGLGRRGDGRAPGASGRGRQDAGRGRAPAGRPEPDARWRVEVDGPRRPNPRDPRLVLRARGAQGRAAAARVRRSALRLAAGRGVHATPRTWRCTGRSATAGGASCGLAGTAYLDAISQACSHASVRSLLTELAVEPLTVKQNDEFRYVSMVIARAAGGAGRQADRGREVAAAAAVPDQGRRRVPGAVGRPGGAGGVPQGAPAAELLECCSGAVPTGCSAYGAPDGFTGELEPRRDRGRLARRCRPAATWSATSLGLWVPGESPRRIGWHLISKVKWESALRVVEARRGRHRGCRRCCWKTFPPQRFALDDPRKVLRAISQRVERVDPGARTRRVARRVDPAAQGARPRRRRAGRCAVTRAWTSRDVRVGRGGALAERLAR